MTKLGTDINCIGVCITAYTDKHVISLQLYAICTAICTVIYVIYMNDQRSPWELYKFYIIINSFTTAEIT